MALAIDGSTPAIVGQTGSTSVVANSFSPPAKSGTPMRPNINATFTTVGNYSGAISVVGESKSVTATNGAFSDTFAQGSTVHIYGPIPNQ
jgi:hypothetical protein